MSPAGFVFEVRTRTSNPACGASAPVTSDQRSAATSDRRSPALKSKPAIAASSRPRRAAVVGASRPRREARGPKGGSFTVMVATPAGAHRATRLWARAGREDQRVLSGAVKASDLQHECAVYRAACDAATRIEAAGGRVARVRVDAELKGAVAARAERARQAKGREAAAAERRRAATELELPMEDGKVLFPDAQIEYVTAAGRAGRCSVEVASPHYASSTIRSKAAAGFQLYAASGRAAAFVRRALSGGGSRRAGGRGGHREIEVFEI